MCFSFCLLLGGTSAAKGGAPYALALKTHKAGRRGGESTARRGGYYFIFSVPARAHTASG
jgi:hypothetical protein